VAGARMSQKLAPLPAQLVSPLAPLLASLLALPMLLRAVP
jgi:hypothetical protein